MEKVVGIIGASGLIGSHLADQYTQLGWRVVRYSRSVREVEGQEWRVVSPSSLEGLHVLVNLAGERIDQRWTDANKERFYESRVTQTEKIAELLHGMEKSQRPKVWLNTSAVGLYGDCGDALLTEDTSASRDYLGQLVDAWEKAAHVYKLEGCRIVHPRVGVVLGKDSLAWRKMAGVFKLGLGGKLGSGTQWFPWIHLTDLVGAYIHLSETSTAEGAFNLVAPECARNSAFTQALAKQLHRPAILPVPAFALKLVLGEFSSALLASQRVSAQKLTASGYKWKFSQLDSAIAQLVSR